MSEEMVDRYLLREKLGQGGMGEIYLGSFEGPNGFRKTVVVKKLLPEAAELVLHFIDEARIGARLDHQNVVGVIDFVQHGGTYYLVLQYVEGATLQEVLKHRRLTVPEAVYILVNIASGLEFVHSAAIDGKPAGIIHRDMSPDNILLSCSGAVLISDFGVALAEVEWRERTKGGWFKGKPNFASPEFMRGLPVGQNSDQYASGLVGYEMLAGRKAFQGISSTWELTNRIVEGLIDPIEKHNPEVPANIISIVRRMHHIDPEQRFKSMREVREALQNAYPLYSLAQTSLSELVNEVAVNLRGRRGTSPYVKANEKIRKILEKKQAEAAGKSGPATENLRPTVQVPNLADVTKMSPPSEMDSAAPAEMMNPGDTIPNPEDANIPIGQRKAELTDGVPDAIYSPVGIRKIDLREPSPPVMTNSPPLVDTERLPYRTKTAPTVQTRINRVRNKLDWASLALGAIAATVISTVIIGIVLRNRSGETVAAKASPQPSVPSSEANAAPAIVGAPMPKPPTVVQVNKKPEAKKESKRNKSSQSSMALLIVKPSSHPVAVIFDNVKLGTAPLEYEIAPGSHEVKLAATDQDPPRVITRTLSARAGVHYTVAYTEKAP